MKHRLYTGIFLFVGTITLSGCAATMVFGRYQTVEFSTEPSGASIYDENGLNIGITPVEIPLRRNGVQRLMIKKDGYHNAEIVMKRTINKLALPIFLLPLVTAGLNPDALIYNLFDVVGGGVFKKDQSAPHLILQGLEESSASNGKTTIVDRNGDATK